MLARLVGADGVGGEMVQQAAQAPGEDELADRAVRAFLAAAKADEQADLGSVEGEAKLVEEAGRDPAERDEGAHRGQLEHLHVLPAEALLPDLEEVLDAP